MRHALPVALLLSACAARNQDPPPAPRTDAQPEPASSAPAPLADTLDASAPDAGGCTVSSLQPGVCAQVPDTVSSEAMKAWFATRGVREDDWSFTSCEELRFGAEPEPVLLCVQDGPFWTDPVGGIATRIEYKRDLVLVTVQNEKPLELLRVPLAVGDDGIDDEVMFTAHYRVDAVAGTIDVDVSKADCDAAPARLGVYQTEKMQGLRENTSISKGLLALILAAERHAAPQDLARIRSICKAAGHYVAHRGGKLAR